MSEYIPRPIDTSAVILPPSLDALLERLAENTHEVWAVQRVAHGWSFGASRDDARKQHPCLIPYDQLPESEKLYDRSTAEEALKVILALGYRIEEPE